VILHVLNGDATRTKLEQSSVDGVLTVWADALHDGPVPAGLADDELARLRAGYFAGKMNRTEEEVAVMATAWNAALAGYKNFKEVVFWLEHDLFDQLILIRHLHWLTTIDAGATRFSLICIGMFPGEENFTGLGALTSEQLSSLPGARQEIAERQAALGGEAWTRFREPEPLALFEWMTGDLSALPFLHGALVRHFEDYPWKNDGLSRSERQMLTAIRDGAHRFNEIFSVCEAMEERVFMGDLTFWSILQGMARGRNPLVSLSDGAHTLHDSSLRITLTDLGAVVLDQGADHAELNDVDRWAGGVHLSASNMWRWDAEQQAVIRDGD
jgi:hypothetical protein